jgi:hypothetical protein
MMGVLLWYGGLTMLLKYIIKQSIGLDVVCLCYLADC